MPTRRDAFSILLSLIALVLVHVLGMEARGFVGRSKGGRWRWDDYEKGRAKDGKGESVTYTSAYLNV